MKDELKIIFIKITYWFGAIMDLLVAVSMTLYIFFDINLGLNLPAITLENKTLLVWGLGLMWGWTILLIWGNMKPIERRSLILITLVPVLFLYMFSDIFIVIESGYIPNLPNFIRDNVLRGILVMFSLTGYVMAQNLAHPKFKR
jgi:hypothetical protein